MFKLEGSVGGNAHQTLVFGEREKLEHREKTFKNRVENQQTQNCVMFGIEPRSHWWKANSPTTLPPATKRGKPKNKQETNSYSPLRHQSLPSTVSQHQDATIRQKQTNICRYVK